PILLLSEVIHVPLTYELLSHFRFRILPLTTSYDLIAKVKVFLNVSKNLTAISGAGSEECAESVKTSYRRQD
ncbi:hypothetical protein, partial [Escherichia coli]|uniref:hypothetical protein n=1 Tax=Escherichia coli TaxID=562 RepID=UPI001BDB9693